ncbi:ABC transporter permease [Telmatocola sphagniphila]|uniref:ABC transporter permease n=1 Tax=Telmatocola sphagniphila TaxID=1123043 RepID=A0A8E6B5H1_9BACT|nr:ABC transporter permease [Telmatocola sphagniphila]QVL31506.1 ABC transporter permease [Telmatocola sphagniphila]
MNRNSLILRNLVYHGRSNLSVLFAAAVGTAVLVGALLVGDSLRGSLRQRAEDQLNGIERVLIAPRFFREELATSLGSTPGLLLQGSVGSQKDPTLRSGKVTVLGTPHLLTESEALSGVALSTELASQLHVQVGDSVQLNVQKASAMPRSSVLGRRGTTDTTQSVSLKVDRILPADHPGNLFQLSPTPSMPLNLFVPLKVLQEALNQPGQINAIFSLVSEKKDPSGLLAEKLTLEDWGLKVHIPKKLKSYISVESKRLVLEPAAVEAAHQAAKDLNFRAADTFVYLANSIAHDQQAIPYSIVAGLDPTQSEPLGKFLPEGVTELKDYEIVLSAWRESPLKVKIGDTIRLEYFEPEIEGEIKSAKTEFKLKGFIPLEGVAADPDLTPEFPGITDKLSISNWDPPFPYDQSRVKSNDDNYWRRYKTTPKAYITLNAARKLFASRFGDTTSVRIAPTAGQDLNAGLTQFSQAFLKHLDPKAGGFVFEPIRERLLKSSSGSNDFGMLFLGFSFFLIVAALLLVGLMFRLNVERRAKEFGLLEASGFSPTWIRSLLTQEGMLLSLIGSLLGLLGAIGFAAGMLYMLKVLWPDASVRSFLRLHIGPTSLIIGLIASVGMSLFAIRWAVRILRKIPPALLLKGVTSSQLDERIETQEVNPRRHRILKIVLWVVLVGGLACLVMGPYMPPGEPRAGSFFSGGSGILIFLLGMLWIRLKSHKTPVRSLGNLAWTNTARNPTRSLLTAGLLASAGFLLVAVESFRREPEADFAKKEGGSGGFPEIMELDVPLFVAPNTPEFLDNLLAGLRRIYQDQKLNATEVASKVKAVEDQWQGKQSLYAFRVRAGDDASCLNLYQATNPRVLGVSAEFLQRGGFVFSDQIHAAENPWTLLEEVSPGEPVPIFVEENTATWMLKKSIGDVFEIPDENGKPYSVKLVGTLKDSPFQSEILMSAKAFLQHYPKQEGYGFFLLDLPEEQQKQLLTGLGVYGPSISGTRQRVANYLAVENTYLTTFQLLGGLGLLLGVLGLAAVLLRNIFERRGELALLTALGYSRPVIRGLLNWENFSLFAVGLAIGVLAALISILPATRLSEIPWLRLGVLLGVVFIAGVIAIRWAIYATLKQKIVSALRAD